jgi:ATP-dependent RNA helicase RhlE
MNQGYVSLKDIEYSVLDEADQMLDMGFIHDIKKIIAQLPAKRQSLFFSATMPPDIVKLSNKLLGSNPQRVTIQPRQTTAEKVEQSVYFVSKQGKPKLLVHLLKNESVNSALVFTRTKHGADKIVRILEKAGINAGAIHGNKSQGQRQRALGSFKSGRMGVLVATDIAARGIDVEELSHVINYDLPNIPETYVHRIGRTGRASASGIAMSFCDTEEKAYLKDIQKLIAQNIPVVAEHPYLSDGLEAPVLHQAKPQRSFKGQRQANRNSNEGRNSRPKRPRIYSQKRNS